MISNERMGRIRDGFEKRIFREGISDDDNVVLSLIDKEIYQNQNTEGYLSLREKLDIRNNLFQWVDGLKNKTVETESLFSIDMVSIRQVTERKLYSTVSIDSPQKAIEILAAEIRDYDREVVALVNIDNSNRPLNVQICSMGTINNALISPREMLKTTILSNASGVIMMHNHPSGDVTPSIADDQLTDSLEKVYSLMGIELKDHIIVGNSGSYYSYAESKKLTGSQINNLISAEASTQKEEPVIRSIIFNNSFREERRYDNFSPRANGMYISAFITNLGKYNEGYLIGEWVDFPVTADEMKAVYSRIGIDGVNYEEVFITDYDTNINGLIHSLGEYESLDELNYLGARLQEMDPDELEIFQAATNGGINESGLSGYINLTYNTDKYVLISDVEDEYDLGHHMISDAHDLTTLGEISQYIDFEAYGRDFMINNTGALTDKGFIYQIGYTSEEYNYKYGIPDKYRIFQPKSVEALKDEQRILQAEINNDEVFER